MNDSGKIVSVGRAKKNATDNYGRKRILQLYFYFITVHIIMYDIHLNAALLEGLGYAWVSEYKNYVPQVIQDAVVNAEYQIVFNWRNLSNRDLFFTNFYLFQYGWTIQKYMNYDMSFGYDFGQFDAMNPSYVIYGQKEWNDSRIKRKIDSGRGPWVNDGVHKNWLDNVDARDINYK